MDTAGIVVFADLFVPIIAKPLRAPFVAIRTSVQAPVPFLRLSSFVSRSSSLVLRPSSLVPREPRGISRGPQPPGRWGRIPKGTAFGIGSLWRVFAYFLHVEKVGRRRRRVWGTNCRGERRIHSSPEYCPLRRDVSLDESFSRSGTTPFLLSEKKRGKETA